MKKAFKVWSWHGMKKEVIKATDLSSHAEARKYGPYVDNKDQLVYWVNWSKPTGFRKKKRRAHFRHYSDRKSFFDQNNIDKLSNESSIHSKKSESEIHKKARLELKEYIEKCINQGTPIEWIFKDTKSSSFSLKGNLLAEAVSVETHYSFKTPFGVKYEYDIAILGPVINKEPIILGAIEIEYTHKFGLKKMLVSKCMSFPLIAIDISDFSLNDITPSWPEKAIKETTLISSDSLRRNYVYLHNFLYSIFLDIPSEYLKDEYHQFIIFTDESSIPDLTDCIKKYAVRLGLESNTDYLLQPVSLNSKDQSNINMFKNEGSIAGKGWSEINESKYLRLQVKRPVDKKGALYLYHFVLARLFNAYFDCLVGYKYRRGLGNNNLDSNVWTNFRGTKKIAPKSVSEPTKTIVNYLKSKNVDLFNMK